MTKECKPAAREYLRVSRDREGRERSITEQQEDNRRAWPDLDIGTAYSDVAISASRYGTKPRGGFTRLMGDLRAGRFAADVLVLWESSRGSRKVSEWVELVEVSEAAGVRIAVTTHGRTYDPANARDRRSLLEDAVDSEYESSKTSARARRAAAANAAAGRPSGRVPYGYRRRYDEHAGGWARVIDPAEAATVRELFDRILKGHSLRSIAADYDARGIRNHSGRPFSPSHLRSMMGNDLYRGKRIHVRGRQGGNRPADPGMVRLYDATWPAIVEERTFLAVRRILSAPERRTSRPGRGVHLLSMIAVCDVCGGPLAATTRHSGRRYQCHAGGHVRVDADALDELAEAVMLGYLARPDNVEALTAADGDGPALDAARLEVTQLRAELDDLADQVGSGAISATLAARAEPAIVARLRDAEGRAEAMSTPSRLRGIIAPGADVARRWKSLPMPARREVVRILLAPDVLGQLRVTRQPYRGCDVTDRVKWGRS